ncbi:hypothetical protein [Bradyrhizobium elkanii]|uniref:hypothetical protein n=1 Tax=Bradyrhizobium elkanii TaxID=29448 RepID=UPI002226622D|nr:hypothetical protein [Bradyrhizobium elkanii]MCW2228061.1 hypothetical protein [Bradyrhizobium elkanii]
MLDWVTMPLKWVAPQMFVGDISTADVFVELIGDLKRESLTRPTSQNDTFMESHGINAPHVPTRFVKVSRRSPVQPRSDFLLACRLADKGDFKAAREVAWRGFNAVCDNAPEYHSQR